MSLYEGAVKKPIMTSLCFLAVAIFGLFSLSKLPVDLYPDIDTNTIMVMTSYQGASASDIENNVTRPLENTLNSVSNLKHITSKSSENISVITLEFEYGYDIDVLTNDVRDKLDMVSSQLPDEVNTPIIFKFSTDMIPILLLSVQAEESQPALYKILDDNVVNPLARVPGVGTVSIAGAPKREVNVYCDPNKLDAYNLTIETISSIIGAENKNTPGGTFDVGSNTYSLRVEGEFKDPREMADIVVGTHNGASVYLRDVAKIVDSVEERAQETYNNGVQGAMIVVQKQSGANSVNISKKVMEQLPKLQKSLPSDVKLGVIVNTSDNILNTIDSLSETIMYAILFVVLVVFIFLGRWRATVIICITIPMSLIASFIYLAITEGGSLNIISLSCLSIAANKNSTKIIGDHTDKYIQAYFQYDSKKTGGITISHLRFGDNPIKSPYYINQADFVACHNPAYVTQGMKMVQDVKPGGVFMINCQWTDEELGHHLNAEAKKYIYDNKIQLYTINAIDKAIEIGMGKRTNTILQSAFFKLADVMPIDDAIKFMKEAAKKSYSKKGDAVVEMNYKAIDAGVDAIHKVEVPDSWANPEADAPKEAKTGRPEVVKLVNDLLEPISKMDGDSLPVSAFKDCADGQFETGASAYEKRGTAVMVPEWDPAACVQCNSCAFVCSHATIRPFILSADEVTAAPANIKLADSKHAVDTTMKYTMSVSPLDCMGCGECVTVCPKAGEAIKMVPQESQSAEQPVFDYLVANVGKKEIKPALVETPIGSQYNQPLLEFSGSCAGCAETSYARLITQLFGEQMYISNATGCSSIWGNPAATSPYTVNKDSKKGPAWCNSLFEDNAEHGLGMYIGQKYIREQAIEMIEEMAASDKASAEFKAAAAKYIETKDDTKANTPATEALVAELEKAAADGCPTAPQVLAKKDYLAKKSVWIFGGDGWAYDIGYGGLDHVLASGENVNVMVFDTEMYSNTGGQASKASNIGEVCQFAAAGKEIGKKSLSEIAMQYGYVYVAQIALGANPAQALKAIEEAESYNGPSLIIGYAPCELHGIAKGGMNHCQDEMKKAVKAGYWNLFSFNPALKAEGKNPFTLTSKEGDGSYQEFLNNEARYTRLVKPFPERAERLFAKSEEVAKERYEHLQKLVELYK